MTSDNIVAYAIYFGVCYLIARNTANIAEQKNFDRQQVMVSGFILSALFILPGLLHNLYHRLVTPRDKWSFK